MSRIGLVVPLLLPSLLAAHDVPDEVRIRAFLKPAGAKMTILVRIPANALIDILFPTLPDSGWLDLKHSSGFAEEGARVWVADSISLYENDRPLPELHVLKARLTRLPDGNFTTYDKAMQHIQQDWSSDSDRFTQEEAAVDVELQTPIGSDSSNFSIEPRFGRVGVRVTTSLAFLTPNRRTRQFEFEGDPQRFHLEPGMWDAILRSVPEGYRHFLNANDYWLFLITLALLFRTVKDLARSAVLLLFSQSVAFFAAAYGLWISSAAAETFWGILVAAAVVYMAFEAIVKQASPPGLALISSACGFVLGTGYWFAYRSQMQFGGTHKLASVLAFDVGLQATQLCALAILAAAVALLLRMPFRQDVVIAVLAAITLRVAWHIMLDRARVLRASNATLPRIPTGVAIFTFLVLLILIAVPWITAKRLTRAQAS